MDEIVADAAGGFSDVFDFPEELVESMEDTDVMVFCNDTEGTQQTARVEVLIRPLELPFTGIGANPLLLVAAASVLSGILLVSLFGRSEHARQNAPSSGRCDERPDTERLQQIADQGAA